MQYVKLVDKIEATAEDVKNRLRAIELNMFNEDKEKLKKSEDKIIVARIELNDDRYRFVSFPENPPPLPFDSLEYICVVDDGQILYRLKTKIETIEQFFVGSVDEFPYKPVEKELFWHKFRINSTPLRNDNKMQSFLRDTVYEAFRFLNLGDRNDKEIKFLYALNEVMRDSDIHAPAKEIVACIDKPLEYNKREYKGSYVRKVTLEEQIIEMYNKSRLSGEVAQS